MAFLAPLEPAGWLGAGWRRQRAAGAIAFVVLAVTVPSTEALQVRRALLPCAGTGVVSAVPLPHGRRVRLELRLPEAQLDEVMRRVMACVPAGEIGRAQSWPRHLASLGPPHAG